jgi:uncharacterized protein YggE
MPKSGEIVIVRLFLLPFVCLSAPLAAQETPPRTIEVLGSGVVQTVPDIARLDFWIRGEGATPDVATKALAARQKEVAGGLVGLLGGDTMVTGSNVTVLEVRDRSCEDAQGYNSRPRLSQGACAVIGYLATMQGSVRTRAVDRIGTAAGLAARLGASDARAQGFELADPQQARNRASAAAIADAKRRAEIAAQAAGVRLGAIMRVSDPNDRYRSEDIGAFARSNSLAPAAPAAPPPPPVEIDVKPRPIQTQAQISVVFAIAP